MPNEINLFKGDYSFLSNFTKCEVEFEGEVYPSVEHAFQAAKTLDSEKRKSFVKGSPVTAKGMGRRLKLREDWEQIKDNVMYICLKSKFQNPDLQKKLLATGDAVLIEGNNHGDRYWGKMLYLAMIDITKKWTGKRRNWGQIHSQLEIFFADRLPQ